jgi:hypothetical protein
MDPHTSNQGRAACHTARDSYLSCVEQNSAALALDATLEEAEQQRRASLAAPACAAPRAAYDAACLPSWRIYWDDRFAKGRPIVGRK